MNFKQLLLALAVAATAITPASAMWHDEVETDEFFASFKPTPAPEVTQVATDVVNVTHQAVEGAKEVVTETVKTVEAVKALTPAEAQRAADFAKFYNHMDVIKGGIAAFGTGAAHYVSKALSFVGGSNVERPASWKNVIAWARLPFAKLAQANVTFANKYSKTYAFGTVAAIAVAAYAAKKAYNKIQAYRAQKAGK